MVNSFVQFYLAIGKVSFESTRDDFFSLVLHAGATPTRMDITGGHGSRPRGAGNSDNVRKSLRNRTFALSDQVGNN